MKLNLKTLTLGLIIILISNFNTLFGMLAPAARTALTRAARAAETARPSIQRPVDSLERQETSSLRPSLPLRPTPRTVQVPNFYATPSRGIQTAPTASSGQISSGPLGTQDATPVRIPQMSSLPTPYSPEFYQNLIIQSKTLRNLTEPIITIEQSKQLRARIEQAQKRQQEQGQEQVLQSYPAGSPGVFIGMKNAASWLAGAVLVALGYTQTSQEAHAEELTAETPSLTMDPVTKEAQGLTLDIFSQLNIEYPDPDTPIQETVRRLSYENQEQFLAALMQRLLNENDKRNFKPIALVALPLDKVWKEYPKLYQLIADNAQSPAPKKFIDTFNKLTNQDLPPTFARRYEEHKNRMANMGNWYYLSTYIPRIYFKF